MDHQNSCLPRPSDALTEQKCSECQNAFTVGDLEEAKSADAYIGGKLVHADCYYASIGNAIENHR